MKSFILLLSFFLLFLLSGCESDSYSSNDRVQDLAPALGAQSSELAFVSECQFQLVESEDNGSGPVKLGLLGLSDSELILVTEVDGRAQSSHRIAIPIEDLESVAQLEDQFHLTYQGEVMVFWLKAGASDSLTRSNYETVYKVLASHQVPVVAAATEYQVPLHSWDGNTTTGRGGSYNIPGVKLSAVYNEVRNSSTRGTQVTGIR